MLNVNLAPASGRVLAYFPDRLVYDEYVLRDDEIIASSGDSIELEGAFEVHLFDGACEFRALLEGGEWTVQVVKAADEIDDEDHFVFTESQFVRERYWLRGTQERIVVNNHFSFSEEGFLRLDGYRLATELA